MATTVAENGDAAAMGVVVGARYNNTVAFNYIGLKVILEKHVSLMLLHIPLTIERLKHNDASKYK